MVFTARIVRHSVVWKLWREHRRTSGVVHGTVFRWVAGDDYVSDELASRQISDLKHNPNVRLEMATNAAAPTMSPTAATPAPQQAPMQFVRKGKRG